MLRALASHHFGLGSNPSVDTVCGLSLLLVLSFAPRGFSPGTTVFPSPQKLTFPNSSSTRNQVDEELLCECATSKSLFILFYFFIWEKYLKRKLRAVPGCRCQIEQNHYQKDRDPTLNCTQQDRRQKPRRTWQVKLLLQPMIFRQSAQHRGCQSLTFASTITPDCERHEFRNTGNIFSFPLGNQCLIHSEVSVSLPSLSTVEYSSGYLPFISYSMMIEYAYINPSIVNRTFGNRT